MKASFLVLALVGSASAFVATPLRATRGAVAVRPAAPNMLVEHVDTLDSVSQLMAMQIPIPAYSLPKGLLMMFCNILIICIILV